MNMKLIALFIRIALIPILILLTLSLPVLYIFSGTFRKIGPHLSGSIQPPLASLYVRNDILSWLCWLICFGTFIYCLVCVFVYFSSQSSVQSRRKPLGVGLLYLIIFCWLLITARAIHGDLIDGMWNNNLERVLRGELSPLWPSAETAQGTEVQHFADTLTWYEQFHILPLAKLFTMGWREEAYLLYASAYGTVTFLFLLIVFKFGRFLWKRGLNAVGFHGGNTEKLQED